MKTLKKKLIISELTDF